MKQQLPFSQAMAEEDVSAFAVSVLSNAVGLTAVMVETVAV